MLAFSTDTMARLFAKLFVSLLASAAAWSVDTRCPMAMNTGSVGSCMFSSCSPSRGPTHCRLGGCYCNSGYCRYPSTTLHIQARYCAARIPGATCHASRFCWSGGLSTSMCDSGLCMCKWAHHPVQQGNGKYLCRPDANALALAVAHNATQEEIMNLLEFQEHADRMAAYNILTGALWVCAGVAFVVGGIVIRKRQSKIECSDYSPLVE